MPSIELITLKKTLVSEGGKYIPLSYQMPEDKDLFKEKVCKMSGLW